MNSSPLSPEPDSQRIALAAAATNMTVFGKDLRAHLNLYDSPFYSVWYTLRTGPLQPPKSDTKTLYRLSRHDLW